MKMKSTGDAENLVLLFCGLSDRKTAKRTFKTPGRGLRFCFAVFTVNINIYLQCKKGGKTKVAPLTRTSAFGKTRVKTA